MELFAVMIQVGYFKLTKRRTGKGKRVFKMTPIHFDQLGWSEANIVIGFWIIAVLRSRVAQPSRMYQ